MLINATFNLKIFVKVSGGNVRERLILMINFLHYLYL